MSDPCPLSDAQIQDAREALASGRNLDPPLPEQQALAARGERPELARRHHWLLVALSQAHAARSLSVEDPAFGAAVRRRVGAGYPGLLKARDDWDPSRGYKFGTYASFWIRQRLARAEREGGFELAG
jgi:hypothetical protein